MPMCPSHQADQQRVLDKVRHVLTAAGFDEAMTASIVPVEWTEAFSPWTQFPPLVSQPAMRGILADAPKDLSPADRIRRSLLPSLLEARRYNESLANPLIELFETARVYLPQDGGLPREQGTLGLVSGQDYASVKGVLEQLVSALDRVAVLEIDGFEHPLLESGKSSALRTRGHLLGYLGEVSAAGLRSFGLRTPCTCAELNLEVLAAIANLIPQMRPRVPIRPSPAIST